MTQEIVMATAEGDKEAGYGLIKVPKATSDVCSSNIVYLRLYKPKRFASGFVVSHTMLFPLWGTLS